MKKLVFFSAALALVSGLAFADDQLRNVQAELKSLGFYYGEVTGQPNAETTAAVRRYQIRNGLEVTGSLNAETLAAVGLEPKGATRQLPAATPKTAPLESPKTLPPQNLRREPTVEERDRNFLEQEEARPRSSVAENPSGRRESAPRSDRSVIDPPEPLDAPSADFPVLFAGTPFANAPVAVQEQTLRKAQATLAGRGHYRDVVDGLPGPATEEALLSFQRSQRLTLTGRLDLETLAQLRLLPGGPRFSDTTEERSSQRAYRGIWIQRNNLRFGLEFD